MGQNIIVDGHNVAYWAAFFHLQTDEIVRSDQKVKVHEKSY
jgi:hypothetical protein